MRRRFLIELREHLIALALGWPGLLFALFWVLLAYMLEGR